MIIKVTQQDINKAKKIKEKGNFRPCVHCPISQSLRRQTKKKIRTFYTVCVIGNKEFKISGTGKDFISKFDAGLRVRPTTIELTEI